MTHPMHALWYRMSLGQASKDYWGGSSMPSTSLPSLARPSRYGDQGDPQGPVRGLLSRRPLSSATSLITERDGVRDSNPSSLGMRLPPYCSSSWKNTHREASPVPGAISDERRSAHLDTLGPRKIARVTSAGTRLPTRPILDMKIPW